MPRVVRRAPRRPRRPAPRPLEQRLTLAAWFAGEMGYSSGREMLEDLRECGEDWGEGFHPVLRRAADRGEVRISADALAEMDDNIRMDLAAINRHRTPAVTLKYFQYLSALSVENFLRRLCDGPGRLLQDLRRFARVRGGEQYPAPAEVGDLNKLALWAATGGGKTLMMHLNYRQFLRRRKSGLFVPDCVLLLTPGEALSEQHIAEMRLSGIPCGRLGENAGGLGMEGDFPVRVVEITKFTARRRGAASIPLDAFDGRNLLLVDEGHKGASGDAYFAARDRLAERGFVLEYSATYGQAFRPDNPRTEEYARSIVFDYSYRHFYNDGYGKEFDVVNLEGEPGVERRDTLMLGNLLVFLQQRMCFAENRLAFARHNLEPPLLLMLGATVTGGQGRTDIVEFLGFLHRVALDSREGAPWLEEATRRILKKESGIADANGDVFANRLNWLRERFGADGDDVNAAEICAALRKHVFRANGAGALHFCSVPGVKGEAALRVAEGEHFGLIYVGDVISKLREIVREDCPGVQVFEETTAERFFPKVAGADSPINILIGAKQFMEGWSSWRVSGMGLLRVGAGEGPLVIQLFGRGVRLKGAGMSLKRGGSPDAPPPPHLDLLETMNIFGVRANFISEFQKILEREGIWEETFFLPVSNARPEVPAEKLMIPQYDGEEEFTDPVLVAPEKGVSVVVDLSSSVLRVASVNGATGGEAVARNTGEGEIPGEALAVVNWDKLHNQMQEFRVSAGLWNLVFPPKNMEEILREHCTFVWDADSPLEPTSRRNIRRIQDAALAAMRKYSRKFYNIRRSAWALKHLGYAPLTAAHPNFPKPGAGYVLRVPQDKKDIIKGIRELVRDREKWEAARNFDSGDWEDPPPRIHFCRHLYQPLLLAEALEKEGISASPVGLNAGEAQFVRDLREHKIPEGVEIFLLRNQSRAGLGFHGEFGAVYPDFILWITRGEEQRIVFVDPHGLALGGGTDSDPKTRLHKTLEGINEKLNDEHPNLKMDSFVVSRTRYRDLSPQHRKWTRDEYRAEHILFAEDSGNIARILRWDD